MIELKSNTSVAKSYIVPISNNIYLFSYLIRTHNTRLDFMRSIIVTRRYLSSARGTEISTFSPFPEQILTSDLYTRLHE